MTALEGDLIQVLPGLVQALIQEAEAETDITEEVTEAKAEIEIEEDTATVEKDLEKTTEVEHLQVTIEVHLEAATAEERDLEAEIAMLVAAEVPVAIAETLEAEVHQRTIADQKADRTVPETEDHTPQTRRTEIPARSRMTREPAYHPARTTEMLTMKIA